MTLALSGLMGKEFDVEDIPRIDMGGQRTESNYTNWPYAEYDSEINDVHNGRYSDALVEFEKVLQLTGRQICWHLQLHVL